MNISDIEQLARLARIELPEGEKEGLLSDMERIVAFVGQIGEVAEEGVAKPQVGIPHNVLRADVAPHEGGIFTERLLSGAPHREGEYLRVKKIL